MRPTRLSVGAGSTFRFERARARLGGLPCASAWARVWECLLRAGGRAGGAGRAGKILVGFRPVSDFSPISGIPPDFRSPFDFRLAFDFLVDFQSKNHQGAYSLWNPS